MHNVQKFSWMPKGTPTFVNPHPQALQIVGTIQAIPGQKLDWEIYLSLLAGRVQAMLLQEDDLKDALELASQILQSSGLLEDTPTVEDAGDALIYNNPLMRERLYEMGIPGQMPKVLDQDDVRARVIFIDTTLEQWMNVLTMMPADPY